MECSFEIVCLQCLTTYINLHITLTHTQHAVPPSVHQLQSNNIEVTEWTTPFTISCSATGSPLPTIHWEREGGKALSVNTEESVITSSNSVRYWGGWRRREKGKKEKEGGVCITNLTMKYSSHFLNFQATIWGFFASPSSSFTNPPTLQVTSTLRFTRQGIRYEDRGGYRCMASSTHTTPASSEYTYITVRRKLMIIICPLLRLGKKSPCTQAQPPKVV